MADPNEHPLREGTARPLRMIDLFEAHAVEFLTDQTGKVWLNVNGICVFRAGKTDHIIINDEPVERPKPSAPGLKQRWGASK